MSASSLPNSAVMQQPAQAGLITNEPLRASTSSNLKSTQDTASFSGEGQPENRVRKWEAAKKSMANSWYLGIPFGLLAGWYSHCILAPHRPTLGGSSGSLVATLAIGVLSSLTSWTFYGGVVGAVTAAAANRKNKKNNQEEDSDTSLNPTNAFMWGAGLVALSNAAATGLSLSGILGENLKETTKSIYKAPKILLPTVGLMALSGVTVGYLAKKAAKWVNQKSGNGPEGEQ